MHLRRRRDGLPVLLLWACCAGCGGASLAPVTGTVTLDGKPLERGTVTFLPVQDGQIGYGSIQPDGRYTVETGTGAARAKGLATGEYRVAVVATGDPPKTDPRGPEQPPPLLVPAKYTQADTSGLRYTVAPAGGKFPIALQSK
jgi:hypothetical protein